VFMDDVTSFIQSKRREQCPSLSQAMMSGKTRLCSAETRFTISILTDIAYKRWIEFQALLYFVPFGTP
jgi:hypothetical protein